MDAIDEQTIHVFLVVFSIMVFFFSGIFLMAQDVREPYTEDVVSVGEPDFNATAHDPNGTDILNVTWETKSVGYDVEIPAGEWTIKGWLADSGWLSDMPDDYTFTIWESFTLSRNYTREVPKIDFEGEVFRDSLLPRLGVDFAEMQDMFGGAPRIVRWALIALPMALALVILKITISIVEAVY